MFNKLFQWLIHLFQSRKPDSNKVSTATAILPNNSNSGVIGTTDLDPEKINDKQTLNIKTMITDEQLQQIYPQSLATNRAKYLPYFNQYLPEYEVTTPIRLWSYFAQIGHESGQLRYNKEIASGQAYEGRKDLGNTEPGDGVRFKGRGLIQITGRSNYQAISNSFGVDFISQPELLETPDYAVKSTFWFWKNNGLNTIADTGDFVKLTRRINGGLNGLADRQAIFDRCKIYLV